MTSGPFRARRDGSSSDRRRGGRKRARRKRRDPAPQGLEGAESFRGGRADGTGRRSDAGGRLGYGCGSDGLPLVARSGVLPSCRRRKRGPLHRGGRGCGCRGAVRSGEKRFRPAGVVWGRVHAASCGGRLDPGSRGDRAVGGGGRGRERTQLGRLLAPALRCPRQQRPRHHQRARRGRSRGERMGDRTGRLVERIAQVGRYPAARGSPEWKPRNRHRVARCRRPRERGVGRWKDATPQCGRRERESGGHRGTGGQRGRCQRQAPGRQDAVARGGREERQSGGAGGASGSGSGCERVGCEWRSAVGFGNVRDKGEFRPHPLGEHRRVVR